MRFSRLRRYLVATVFLAAFTAENTAIRADEAKPVAEEKPAAEAKSAAEEKPASAPPPIAAIRRQESGSCLVDEQALADLKARKAELEAKQKELEAKTSELQAREKALEEQIAKLDAIREDMAKTEAFKKKEVEEKVIKLVETVESMSPKAAAQLISQIDETLAVSAVARISNQKLAKILNLMETKRSARLSEALVGIHSRASATNASQSRKGGDSENGHSKSHEPSGSGSPANQQQPGTNKPVEKGAS